MRIEALRPHPAEAAKAVGGTDDVHPIRPGLWAETRRESAHHEMLGLSPTAALAEIPDRMLRVAENARRVQDRLEEMARLHDPKPTEGLWAAGLFAMPRQRERDAVLHPPVHELVPSARVVSEYQASLRSVTPQEPERG